MIESVMLVALLAAACVVCGFAVWALREAVSTLRAVRELTDETRERLGPLLDKADVTIDAVNVELLRIDTIIGRFEDASEKVSTASGTISGIVHAPAGIVNDVALRVRKAWKDRGRTPEERYDGTPAPDAAGPDSI